MGNHKNSPWTYEEAVTSLNSFFEEKLGNPDLLIYYLLGQMKSVLNFENWTPSAKVQYLQYLTKAYEEITKDSSSTK
ncbi:hypothetical protein [Brevibacillus sp. 179-C9.3 HS]|uniref:hypothetical protein n=1 Tax=unclassified Brevibacillus TaxID=2684853 RepID=UPI0039A1F230